MIAGVGIDIVEVARIERMLDRFSDEFLARVFTAAELAEGARRHRAPTFYAGRWAVKEAASKALGCGIGSCCALVDVETLSDPDTGVPRVSFSGAAARFIAARGGGRCSLSLSHEAKYAAAVVIFEQ